MKLWLTTPGVLPINLQLSRSTYNPVSKFQGDLPFPITWTHVGHSVADMSLALFVACSGHVSVFSPCFCWKPSFTSRFQQNWPIPNPYKLTHTNWNFCLRTEVFTLTATEKKIIKLDLLCEWFNLWPSYFTILMSRSITVIRQGLPVCITKCCVERFYFFLYQFIFFLYIWNPLFYYIPHGFSCRFMPAYMLIMTCKMIIFLDQ